MTTRANRGNAGQSRDAGANRRRDGAPQGAAARRTAGTSRPVGASRTTRTVREQQSPEEVRAQRRARLANLPRIEDEPRPARESRDSKNASHRANVNRAARTGHGHASQTAPGAVQPARSRSTATAQAGREPAASKKAARSRGVAPVQAGKEPAASKKAKRPSTEVPAENATHRPGRRAAASGQRAETDNRAVKRTSPTRRAARGSDAANRAPEEGELVSTSIGELRRSERRKRAQRTSRRYVLRIIVAVSVIAVLVVGWIALYHSPAFTIQNVQVNGVEHLTSEEMATLANVPPDSTLLRVDTGTIEKRLEQNAWVADAQINLVFPDTLQINVTERPVRAVIEIPTSNGTSVKKWLISNDRIWLMPVPDAGSDAAKTTSSKVYDDAASVIHVVDVPIGTKAEIGSTCTDANVNNALDILEGLTTDLSGQVAEVSAAGTAETTLLLDSGVEVAFGKAEDIRDKERVVLQILQDNPDNVTYINVRIPQTPTWRAV